MAQRSNSSVEGLRFLLKAPQQVKAFILLYSASFCGKQPKTIIWLCAMEKIISEWSASINEAFVSKIKCYWNIHDWVICELPFCFNGMIIPPLLLNKGFLQVILTHKLELLVNAVWMKTHSQGAPISIGLSYRNATKKNKFTACNFCQRMEYCFKFYGRTRSVH